MTTKPTKTGPTQCHRCYGTGSYSHGTCFRCNGGRVDPTAKSWVYPADWTDLQRQAHVDSLAAKRDAVAARKAAKRLAVHAGNVAFCPPLGRLDDDAYRATCSRFAENIWHQSFDRPLTDRQLEAVSRDVLRCAEQAVVVHAAVPAGRSTIEGKILSIKESSFRVAGRERITLKCLVKCDGFKVYGTLPAAISGDAAVGDTVRITANLAQKEPGFGLFSRPTKSEILLSTP